MCNNCNKSMCIPAKIGKILLVIGGLNWGILGLGMILNKMPEWNVVAMLLDTWPTVLAIVYILVGIAAVMKMIGCRCKTCMANCTCDSGASAK